MVLMDHIIQFTLPYSSPTQNRYTRKKINNRIFICCRRFVWNFFRLENEHLNNCGKFRAVRDISVAPMNCSDQMLIVRMMDEEDGVVNRRKQKLDHKKREQRLTLEGESTDDMD